MMYKPTAESRSRNAVTKKGLYFSFQEAYGSMVGHTKIINCKVPQKVLDDEEHCLISKYAKKKSKDKAKQTKDLAQSLSGSMIMRLLNKNKKRQQEAGETHVIIDTETRPGGQNEEGLSTKIMRNSSFCHSFTLPDQPLEDSEFSPPEFESGRKSLHRRMASINYFNQ